MLKKLILFLTSLFIAVNSFAINEQEFVQLLQKNHPFFKIENVNLRNLSVAKKIANPYDEWNFSSTMATTKVFGGVNNNSLVNIFNVENIDGTTTKLSNTLTFSKSLNQKYNNTLALDYTIPLSQNKDGINNSLNLDLSNIDLIIGNLQNKIDKNNFINNNLKKLWNLKFLQLNTEINRKILQKEGEQLLILQKKMNNNLVDSADALLQQNNYQAKKINLISANSEELELQSEIENIIKVKIQNINLNLENLNFKPQNLEIYELSKIKILNLQQQKINRQIISLEDKSKSKIDLNVGINSTRNGNSVFGSRDDNSVSLGLTIALPLGGDVNSNLLLSQQNNLDALSWSVKQASLDLKNNYNTIIMQLKSLKEISIVNKQQLITSNQRVLELEKMYLNNNTELQYVINAKNDKYNTQLTYYKNLLKYKNLQFDYLNLNQ